MFFAGHHFGVWDSYGLAGYDFRSGSFVEDSRGRWYFCLCVLVKPAPSLGEGGVGIDLGMKTSATCSDGQTLEGRTYRRHEAALGVAQRAGKTARARAIDAKIRNRRQDALHKFSTKLVRQYGEIYVGSVSGRKLVKTRLAKSVLDAGWSRLKTMLEYKSRQAGVVYREIDEAWTTQSCSECGALGGPKGLQGLGTREWECGHCGGVHDRDVNAARNILALGRGHAPPAEGIPCL